MLTLVQARELWQFRRGQYDALKRLPPELRITCLVCDGQQPTPELCGCGGTSTVAEAIRYLETEMEILNQ